MESDIAKEVFDATCVLTRVRATLGNAICAVTAEDKQWALDSIDAVISEVEKLTASLDTLYLNLKVEMDEEEDNCFGGIDDR